MVSADGRFRVEIAPTADLTDEAALGRFIESVRTVAPRATGGAIGAGIVLIVAWVLWESHNEQRFFPVSLFKNPIFLAAIVAGFIYNFGNAVALWGDAMWIGNPTGNAAIAYAGDVHLVDLPRVESAPYCQATPNSTGAPARIELACPGILGAMTAGGSLAGCPGERHLPAPPRRRVMPADGPRPARGFLERRSPLPQILPRGRDQ